MAEISGNLKRKSKEQSNYIKLVKKNYTESAQIKASEIANCIEFRPRNTNFKRLE